MYHPTSSCLGQSTGQMNANSGWEHQKGWGWVGLGWLVGWLLDVTKTNNTEIVSCFFFFFRSWLLERRCV